ncbi:MAG: hydrogen gas-evolving membrane-bound hydrogenase subunit E [Candidatus Omnitrophota bacterium]
MLELHILILFMIAGAIIAIEVKDLLSSVIAVGAIGLALSIMFLLLKAPDVAITQLVVEILCLIILIRATLKKDLPFSTTGRWLLNTSIAVCFIILFLFISAKALSDLPQFGKPIMRVSKKYLEEGFIKNPAAIDSSKLNFRQTGAANLVSAVILDYRAYDTIGEATVLFTAVIGVLALVRKKGRKEEGLLSEEDDE